MIKTSKIKTLSIALLAVVMAVTFAFGIITLGNTAKSVTKVDAATFTESEKTLSNSDLTCTWDYYGLSVDGTTVTIVNKNSSGYENGLYIVAGSKSAAQFNSSKYLSLKGDNSDCFLYIPVPAGAAGSITTTWGGSASTRYWTLYTDASTPSATEKYAPTGSGKTSTITFTSSNIVTVTGDTYIKTGITGGELKFRTISVTLTTGSYASTYDATIEVDSTDSYGTVSSASVTGLSGTTNYSVASTTLTIGTTDVTATPTADTDEWDYEFDGWYTGGSKIASASSISAAATFTAHFTSTKKTYTITVESNNEDYGTVDVSSISSVPYGTTISVDGNELTINGTTVTATAVAADEDYIYSFDGWSVDDGDTTGTAATITATFSREDKPSNLDIEPAVHGDCTGWGTVTGSAATVAFGSSYTIDGATLTIGEEEYVAAAASATAQYTYAFEGWYIGGSIVTEDGTLESDEIFAKFTRTPVSYTLTWSLDGGSISVAGSHASGASVPFGTAITAPKVTKDGYDFAGWSPAVASTMPAANTTYTATWTEHVTYTIYVDLNNGTALQTISGIEPSTTLATVLTDNTLSATRSNWTFQKWTTDGVGGSATFTASSAVENGDTYTANYTRNDITGISKEVHIIDSTNGYSSSGDATDNTVGVLTVGSGTTAIAAGTKTVSFGGAMAGTGTRYIWFIVPSGYTATVDLQSSNQTGRELICISENDITFVEDSDPLQVSGYKSGYTKYASCTGTTDLVVGNVTITGDGVTKYFVGSAGSGKNITALYVHLTATADSVTLAGVKTNVKSGETVANLFPKYGVAANKGAHYGLYDGTTAVTESTTVTNGHTYVWKDAYTVTVAAGTNGTVGNGTTSGQSSYVIEDVLEGTELTFDDNTVAFNDVTYTATASSGYTFDAWSSEPSSVTADVTLTASYNPLITYAGNGNTSGSTASTEIVDGVATVAANGFVKTDYAFDYWTASVDVTTSEDDVITAGDPIAAGTALKSLSAPLTLTAQWSEQVEVDLAWSYDGGTPSGDYTAAGTIYGGSSITAPTVTKTGYTFTGWSPAFTGTMPNEDTTYVAQWSANDYNVSFNANGGEGSMDAQSITFAESEALTANEFTRTGYTFAGWATTNDGSVAYADEASYTMATEGATLYAVWNVNSYTLTVSAGRRGTVGNGTTSGQDSYEVEIDYNSEITRSSNTLTVDGVTYTITAESGFSFRSWTGYAANMPDEDLTITATYAGDYAVSLNFGDTDFSSWTTVTSLDEAHLALLSEYGYTLTNSIGGTSATTNWQYEKNDGNKTNPWYLGLKGNGVTLTFSLKEAATVTFSLGGNKTGRWQLDTTSSDLSKDDMAVYVYTFDLAAGEHNLYIKKISGGNQFLRSIDIHYADTTTFFADGSQGDDCGDTIVFPNCTATDGGKVFRGWRKANDSTIYQAGDDVIEAEEDCKNDNYYFGSKYEAVFGYAEDISTLTVDAEKNALVDFTAIRFVITVKGALINEIDTVELNLYKDGVHNNGHIYLYKVYTHVLNGGVATDYVQETGTRYMIYRLDNANKLIGSELEYSVTITFSDGSTITSTLAGGTISE